MGGFRVSYPRSGVMKITRFWELYYKVTGNFYNPMINFFPSCRESRNPEVLPELFEKLPKFVLHAFLKNTHFTLFFFPQNVVGKNIQS